MEDATIKLYDVEYAVISTSSDEEILSKALPPAQIMALNHYIGNYLKSDLYNKARCCYIKHSIEQIVNFETHQAFIDYYLLWEKHKIVRDNAHNLLLSNSGYINDVEDLHQYRRRDIDEYWNTDLLEPLVIEIWYEYAVVYEDHPHKRDTTLQLLITKPLTDNELPVIINPDEIKQLNFEKDINSNLPS